MAAALLNHHAMGRVNVVSAGSTPAEEVNHVAGAAMAEWGLDISSETPTAFTDDDVRAADIVGHDGAAATRAPCSREPDTLTGISLIRLTATSRWFAASATT